LWPPCKSQDGMAFCLHARGIYLSLHRLGFNKEQAPIFASLCLALIKKPTTIYFFLSWWPNTPPGFSMPRLIFSNICRRFKCFYSTWLKTMRVNVKNPKLLCYVGTNFQKHPPFTCSSEKGGETVQSLILGFNLKEKKDRYI